MSAHFFRHLCQASVAIRNAFWLPRFPFLQSSLANDARSTQRIRRAAFVARSREWTFCLRRRALPVPRVSIGDKVEHVIACATLGLPGGTAFERRIVPMILALLRADSGAKRCMPRRFRCRARGG
jgi:hypothetical protein